ncbi:Clp protease N-terminal domain-containing protein [Streptomyces camelliae]|uniref:Peptidase n=1 Tax=Streptomyces camelliae TaxID=3004093 RepID=A0ABY7P2Y8_9ACTN|nr:Clp protease N-terminal domain-containing protein [Streptomyces sp. HUAS 2-6]WBO63910.1 peptidase [Streptomyces sp. HUAS 2-6]
MFERFTKDAREVVQSAAGHCERAGERTVGAEHLLLALLDRESGRASSALTALGLTERTASVRQALDEARRRAGLSRAEADALAGLGIDVSEIVSRVEEVHGVGAMSVDPADSGRRSGRRPFGKSAKDVLVAALRSAVDRSELPHARIRSRGGTTVIGDEHILLALTVRPGVAGEVLADHGVTYESVQRVL